MCSDPCESELTCFLPESNLGPYGLLNFLSAALSTTELWWRMNHRKSFRTLLWPTVESNKSNHHHHQGVVMVLHEDVDWKTNKAWGADTDCIVSRENGGILLFSLHKIVGPNRTNKSHQHKPTKHSQAEFAVASHPPLLQLVLSSLIPENIKTCVTPVLFRLMTCETREFQNAITIWFHEKCTGNN